MVVEQQLENEKEWIKNLLKGTKYSPENFISKSATCTLSLSEFDTLNSNSLYVLLNRPLTDYINDNVFYLSDEKSFNDDPKQISSLYSKIQEVYSLLLSRRYTKVFVQNLIDPRLKNTSPIIYSMLNNFKRSILLLNKDSRAIA